MSENIKKTEEKVKKYIEENDLVNKNDKIIIGLSGGADSVFLLMILDSLKDELGFSLMAIHVNHGIRGEEADLDEKFVIKLCEDRKIPVKTYKVDIPSLSRENHESLEECGRHIRYKIFNEEAKKDNCKIAIAHHMDDQAETVIFRVARGTGIKGIAGMKPSDGRIIRPLLCLRKKEIMQYLSDCLQEHREDITNEDTLYSRNLIRREITPLFERINDGAVEHIASLSQEALKVSEYIEKQAYKLLDKAFCEGETDKKHSSYQTNIIAGEDEVIRHAAIRNMIKAADVPLKDITREHIEQIDRLLDKREASTVVLARSEKVIIEAGKIYVARKRKNCEDDFRIDITEEGTYELPGQNELSVRLIEAFENDTYPQSPYTKWFDYDKISNGLCIRTRQSGDYLVIGEKGERKSLKDYMINEKIPRSERESQLILANDSRVAWVVGRRISWDVKVSGMTKTVVEISIKMRDEKNG